LGYISSKNFYFFKETRECPRILGGVRGGRIIIFPVGIGRNSLMEKS
jgi:hypothetical protein